MLSKPGLWRTALKADQLAYKRKEDGSFEARLFFAHFPLLLFIILLLHFSFVAPNQKPPSRPSLLTLGLWTASGN